MKPAKKIENGWLQDVLMADERGNLIPSDLVNTADGSVEASGLEVWFDDDVDDFVVIDVETHQIVDVD